MCQERQRCPCRPTGQQISGCCSSILALRILILPRTILLCMAPSWRWGSILALLTWVPSTLPPGVPPAPVWQPPPPLGAPPLLLPPPGMTPLLFLKVSMYVTKLGVLLKGDMRLSTFCCTKNSSTHLVNSGISTAVSIVACCFFSHFWRKKWKNQTISVGPTLLHP